MAQYTYNYACGHGQGVARLFGKNTERERKLAWMEKTYVCPECYKKQKAEEDAAAPKTAILHLSVYQDVYLSIEVQGQIQAHKQALYDLGYRWSDAMGDGLLALFSPPKRALQKIEICPDFDDLKSIANRMTDEIKAIGYKVVKIPSDLDVFAARHYYQKKAERKEAEKQAKLAAAKAREEKQAAIKKVIESEEKMWPPLNPPQWYQDIQTSNKYWNNKIYGSDKYGWRIYIDGKEIRLSVEQKTAYDRWLKDETERTNFIDDRLKSNGMM